MWSVIRGFERYEASDPGEIRSLYNNRGQKRETPREIKQRLNKFGYYSTTIYKDKQAHNIQAHRLVALAFIENPDNLPQVNHKNEDRTDNRVENLEWCSRSYNINYGHRNEIVSRKLRAIKEKTSARRIRQINAETGETVRVWNSMRAIERELGIFHSNIYNCCRGKRHTRAGYKWEYCA